MDDELFQKLIESASQAAEIVCGERSPSRVFEVTSDVVREVRAPTTPNKE